MINALREYIKEVVIHAEPLFYNRRRTDPELAKRLNNSLREMPMIVDEMINIRRMKLAAPNAFVDNPKTSVLDAIAFAPHDYQDELEQVKRFVRDNASKFENVVEMMRDLVEQIDKTPDALEWVGPWRTYSMMIDFMNFVKNTL